MRLVQHVEEAIPTRVQEEVEFVLGDEAVALGAMHAGVSCSFGYPGTPSTEIMEYLIHRAREHGSPRAEWCSNEKTAYEAALGVSLVGKRALVCMKHVGLNVAADPFINSALVSVHGGLVLVVADDPAMHSSQNEQDSRYFADFARILCLEPACQQEAYDMTVEAFDLSERFHIPVMIRLVTRLAHSRTSVKVSSVQDENPLFKAQERAAWTLLPGNARRQWRELLIRHEIFREYSETCSHNVLTLENHDGDLGVITTGIARDHFMENRGDLPSSVSHLHIGVYPPPIKKIQKLADRVKRLLVLEEGYPFLERYLRGFLPTPLEILGKQSGHVPAFGELDPDIVGEGLALPERVGIHTTALPLPKRPPQLCAGCPHRDSYAAIKLALTSFEDSLVTSDIGCYTLGALPPYRAIESCVCMGASIGMARGAAEAGFYPVVAVIGDSTFLHSGITPLMDAVASNADMTVVVLDNDAVAMTGGQPTILPSSRLEKLLLGIGVDPGHLHVLEASPQRKEENANLICREVEHHGLSVIISRRMCLEVAKKVKKERSQVEP